MDETVRNLTLQLESLYEERAFLARELGLSDARAIVAMVRSLEAQLNDLYAQAQKQGQNRTHWTFSPSNNRPNNAAQRPIGDDHG